jgi:hypothetical protein
MYSHGDLCVYVCMHFVALSIRGLEAMIAHWQQHIYTHFLTGTCEKDTEVLDGALTGQV